MDRSDLRKVIVSKLVREELSTGTGRISYKTTLVPVGEAFFHQFGVNFEEYDSGPGNFTTAIIEWPNGQLENVPVDHVQFIS